MGYSALLIDANTKSDGTAGISMTVILSSFVIERSDPFHKLIADGLRF